MARNESEFRLGRPEMLPRIFLVWLCVSLFRFFGRTLADLTPTFERLAYQAAQVVIWTLVTYALFLAVDRVPIERLSWKRVPFLLAVFAAVTFGRMFAEAVVQSFLTPAGAVAVFRSFVRMAIDKAILDTVFVWLIGHGVRAYQLKQLMTLQSVELQRLLAQAQFENLKSQLQPHFLFNTLHSLAALVGGDPAAAKTVIARLGELLRLALATASRTSIPLRAELEILSAYLAIQNVRFEDRLTVTSDVAHDVLDAAVPPFILQPLVENAIRHGVETVERKCHVALRARRDGKRLCIDIADDGRWPEHAIVEGIGLSNTRQRLQMAYGREFAFELRANASGGTTVAIELPLEILEEEAPLAVAAAM